MTTKLHAKLSLCNWVYIREYLKNLFQNKELKLCVIPVIDILNFKFYTCIHVLSMSCRCLGMSVENVHDVNECRNKINNK